MTKYDVSGLAEAQWQPGSRGRVLRNLPGVTSKREMDRLEAEAQVEALETLIGEYGTRHRFTAGDIRHMHKVWLGSIYPWAGSWRQVNLSKGEMPFAASAHVPKLMAEFEQGPLSQFTPCRPAATTAVARGMAEVHVELMLIHPFRDGNGRLGRMLSVLMGLQAGLPLLNFGDLKGAKRMAYFAAVRAGLDRDYDPMQGVFEAVIARSLRRRASQSSGGARGEGKA